MESITGAKHSPEWSCDKTNRTFSAFFSLASKEFRNTDTNISRGQQVLSSCHALMECGMIILTLMVCTL